MLCMHIFLSAVLHAAPDLDVTFLEARVKSHEDQLAALEKQLKKPKDDAFKEKGIKEVQMVIIQKSYCKLKGIDTHLELIVFRPFLY